MNSAAGSLKSISKKDLGYEAEYRAKAGAYVAKQHLVVRGLHRILQGVSWLLVANATVFFGFAMYQTVLWIATGSLTSLGDAAYLPNAWVNFGLSMSFMVFPWGLDSMLLRAFPAVIFPLAWYRSNRPIRFMTGPGAFFAGFGIMCAGAPGAAHFFNLASQLLAKLF